MKARRPSLARAVDRAVAEANARYLAWAAAYPAEAQAELDRDARLAWAALGWCQACGSPDHSTHPKEARS